MNSIHYTHVDPQVGSTFALQIFLTNSTNYNSQKALPLEMVDMVLPDDVYRYSYHLR